jgi:hypothetical protein
MESTAETLVRWAHDYVPGTEDLELAQRSLLDTVAVTLAARQHDLVQPSAGLPAAACWATVGHVLDFDDLHMTTCTWSPPPISAWCACRRLTPPAARVASTSPGPG